ncbi:hypothetical protein F4774DRAFT_390030 [Daldinia eschscholtzii]|nr:hypothetical protein F4774DRAFT_390030 [Daldinia eschscholtzii]
MVFFLRIVARYYILHTTYTHSATLVLNNIRLPLNMYGNMYGRDGRAPTGRKVRMYARTFVETRQGRIVGIEFGL